MSAIKSLKILHLASDQKFIDIAINEFERVAPGCNELLVCGKRPLKYVKSEATVIGALEAISSTAAGLPRYDIVIAHSLNPIWFRLIKSLHSSSVIVWLGWGYDYYDIIFRERSCLLLDETKKWLLSRRKEKFKKYIRSIFSKAIVPSKKSTIGFIDVFCPVLPSEYNLTKYAFKSNNFPRQGFWNYGSLEEDLIKGFEGHGVTGKNILAGNSASAENNHLDTFSLLSEVGVGDREIISPLSYGDHQYKELVISQGKAKFGGRFKPLVDFMPIQEYVKTIQSCGFVIMNHLRQQAVGNIVIMLYLGAKVFLDKNCPTFDYFKSQGVVVFSTDELRASPRMLSECLDASDVSTNRQALAATWSKEASQRRTSELLSLVALINK